jgi:hypothetical protein
MESFKIIKREKNNMNFMLLFAAIPLVVFILFRLTGSFISNTYDLVVLGCLSVFLIISVVNNYKLYQLSFRIKIEEKVNGSKGYIPQTKDSVFGKWENICCTEYLGSFETSRTMSQSYDNEDKAIEIVERYRAYITRKNGRKVKSIEYKIIN